MPEVSNSWRNVPADSEILVWRGFMPQVFLGTQRAAAAAIRLGRDKTRQFCTGWETRCAPAVENAVCETLDLSLMYRNLSRVREV
jgi:hypothetical protein